jgi:tripartite ATP-independent transporter DctM subunit
MEAFPPGLMFAALFGLVFAGVPVAFALIATSFLFGLPVLDDRLGNQFFGRFYEVASNSVLTAVPLFVLMGVLLEKSGIAERLFHAMRLWVGRLPGGLAIAAIAMCAIFAAATGIIGAVEAIVGMMAIPPMLRYGYEKGLISGTICAGGSLGTIIPPSVLVVVYSGVGQVPVGDLLAGIMLPSLLMVVLFILYIYIRCRIRPQDGPPLAAEEVMLPLRRKLVITAAGLVPATCLIVAVLGSILAGIASPTEAAAIGAAGSLALLVLYRSFGWTVLVQAARKTVSLNAMILLIVLGGMMFSSVFAVSGGTTMVRDTVTRLALPGWALVCVFLLVVFALGFILDWVSVVLICVPVFAPLIRAAGVDPLWFAVMVIIVIQTSYLTPPMAPAIFYLRAIAPPEISYIDMYRGVVPFVLAQGAVLAAVAAFPSLATWLPRALLGA